MPQRTDQHAPDVHALPGGAVRAVKPLSRGVLVLADGSSGSSQGGSSLGGSSLASAPAPARPRVIEVIGPDVVRTARLTLRTLRAGDRDQFTRVLRASRDHVAKGMNLHRPGETDEACFDRMLSQTHEGDATGKAWRRVAEVEGGRLVGMFQVLGIERGLSPKGDAGWWIEPASVGRGLATEGTEAMVRVAMSDPPTGLGLFRIEAAITPDNLASKRVAERAGLRQVGGAVCSIKLGERWALHEVWAAG